MPILFEFVRSVNNALRIITRSIYINFLVTIINIPRIFFTRKILENISIKSSSGWPIVNCTMLRVQANVSIHGSMIEEFRQESNIIYTVIDILINEFILHRLNEGSRTRRTRIESIWNVKQISMVPPSSSCRSDVKVMNAPAFSKVARRLARVA